MDQQGYPTPAVRAVLLDVDGTLLDSNDAHARAWIEALEGEGSSLPFDQIKAKIGKGGDKVLWELLRIEESSALGQKIAGNRRAIFESRYLPNLAPFPKARELVGRMKRDHKKLVVATSASPEEIDGLLTAAGVRDLLEETITKGDASRSKPDGDIVVAAVRRAGVPAQSCVMVGDTPYDVEAARRAGVRTIALRSGGWSDSDLAGAIAIYDDPADLLKQYDASALGKQTLREDSFASAEGAHSGSSRAP